MKLLLSLPRAYRLRRSCISLIWGSVAASIFSVVDGYVVWILWIVACAVTRCATLKHYREKTTKSQSTNAENAKHITIGGTNAKISWILLVLSTRKIEFGSKDISLYSYSLRIYHNYKKIPYGATYNLDLLLCLLGVTLGEGKRITFCHVLQPGSYLRRNITKIVSYRETQRTFLRRLACYLLIERQFCHAVLVMLKSTVWPLVVATLFFLDHR